MSNQVIKLKGERKDTQCCHPTSQISGFQKEGNETLPPPSASNATGKVELQEAQKNLLRSLMKGVSTKE